MSSPTSHPSTPRQHRILVLPPSLRYHHLALQPQPTRQRHLNQRSNRSPCLPAVASGHVLHLILSQPPYRWEQYGCSDESLQFRMWLACPHDFDTASINQYHRAVEAPPAVCNQFVQLGIILWFAAAGARRPWSASWIFCVWLLTMWTESVMLLKGGVRLFFYYVLMSTAFACSSLWLHIVNKFAWGMRGDGSSSRIIPAHRLDMSRLLDAGKIGGFLI
ncbi:hypothetical protein QC764_0097790 [Podospora pseudoanserina]|uniref:Uncharacterized protein n=1 Tax=Podospora pseudoanserina TaxID=2609844 RepID=A0ABR0HU78_9PEZI|nr:hypothetical protein QC764_0097790 [Podospora pseudoanserina]